MAEKKVLVKKTKGEKAAEAVFIKGFKGFNKDLTCRDFKFEKGKTFKHDGTASSCNSGFHFCENPLDVFGYYAPGESVFHEVEGSGQTDKHADDSKVACTEIKIGAAITLPDFIGASLKFMFSRKYETSTSNHITQDRSASSATGYSSASSATGDSSASSATGDRSASSATGYRSASSATGDRSASSATGDRSASSATGYSSASSATGDSSASSATGDRSASSATGDRSASSATGDSSASSATGDRSASSATGYSSASSATGDSSASSATGDRSASSATGDSSASSATGKASVAVSTGCYGKAMAGEYGCIALALWNADVKRYEMRCAETGCGDGSDGKLKAEVWYTLDEAGQFVEA
jgi:hypothetical protein